MNPYAILGALVVLGGLLFGAEHAGESRGRALQTVDDGAKIQQKETELGHVRDDLAVQKAQSAAVMAAAASQALRSAQEAAQRHQQQELAHENEQARTEVARRAFADAVDRRVRELAAGAVPARPGGPAGGAGALPAAPDAAGVAGAPVVQLSVEGVRGLGTLFLDADALADNYRTCYRALYPAWRAPLSPPDAITSAPPPDGPAPTPGDTSP